MRLSEITAAHVPQVVAISRLVSNDPLTERGCILVITHPCRFCLGIFVEDDLKSFMIGLLVGGDLDVVALASHPNYQRLGFASRLLEACRLHSNIRRIFLEVDIENVGANILYKKFGFQKVGIRKKYYRGIGDAQVMVYPSL